MIFDAEHIYLPTKKNFFSDDDVCWNVGEGEPEFTR